MNILADSGVELLPSLLPQCSHAYMRVRVNTFSNLHTVPANPYRGWRFLAIV